MAERAGLFDEVATDLDVTGFAPKTNRAPQPAPEIVREVSERATFRSREPAPPAAKTSMPAKNTPRRHRTGRNLQLNMKVDAETFKLFYEIADQQNWVSGETMKNALAALQRELAAKA